MEYSNHLVPNEPSFWRLCLGDTCHCDFRMTIKNCAEHGPLHTINYIDISWSILATLVAFGIVYFRVVYRNQQIFDFSNKIPRPKAIEIRAINATILIGDYGKNAMFRSLMFEIPWQFGVAALSSYLFGVVQTLSNNSKSIYKAWLGSQTIADAVYLIVISLPIIMINPVALVAGYYAQQENIEKAIKYTETIYILWLIYVFVLSCLILIAGLRLLAVLKNHLVQQDQKDHKENVEKIRLGTTKVKIIIGMSCICLWVYCAILALYASSRELIMKDLTFTVIITALALFNGPLATSIIEFALILNIQILNGMSNLTVGGSSTGSQSNHQRSTSSALNQSKNDIHSSKEHKHTILSKSSSPPPSSNPFGYSLSSAFPIHQQEKASNYNIENDHYYYNQTTHSYQTPSHYFNNHDDDLDDDTLSIHHPNLSTIHLR
ncbi:unnamed protein product [Cunninghamella blakesleeana]